MQAKPPQTTAMFESYKKILNPPSIVEAVDREILHALMTAFSFRQGTAMTLLYDSLASPPVGQDFHRLDPFPDSSDDRNQKIFNPFCRRLRENKTIDKMCRECDEHNAYAAFLHQQDGLRCYQCHIGLYDLTYPIRVADSIRGVLFSGQRAPLWDDGQMKSIRQTIRSLVPKWGDELDALVSRVHFGEQGQSPMAEFESLKSEFSQFGELFQKVVTNVYEVKRAQSKTEAIVEVSKHISQSAGNDQENWTRVIDEVLQSLEELFAIPLMLFVRRESRFLALCASKRLASEKNKAFPVVEFVAIQDLVWHEFNSGCRIHQIIGSKQAIPGAETSSPYSLYRVDQKVNLSAMLVVAGKLNEQQQAFLSDIARILAAQANEGVLFDRLRVERERFAKEVTFTGHTLKTPLQGVFFQLRRLQRYSQGHDLSRDDAGRLFLSTRKQILNAVFDAQQLQIATRDLRKSVAFLDIAEDLCKQCVAKAADRGVTVRYDNRIKGTASVHAVESHVRVALSNLLDNAIKYSFQNKVVVVSVERVRRDAVIMFSNYGVGISDAHRDQLFEYGHRAALNDTKRERVGFGLGLMQAKQFIESCGGSLHIENRVLNEKNTSDIRQLVEVRVTLPLLG